MRIAQVATDAAIGRAFDYAIPDVLEGRISEGSLVRVPFGHRTIDAIVLSIADKSEWGGTLKPIQGVASGEPWVAPPLLRLAKWMAAYYLAPIELCLRAVLPPAIRDGTQGDGFKRRLAVRRAQCAKEASLPEKKLTPRQAEILSRLDDDWQLLAGFCETWKVSANTVKALQTLGLAEIEERVELRDPLRGRKLLPSRPLPLNQEQQNALSAIAAALDTPAQEAAPRPILLHGVTGSGKTEVYLQAIAKVLDEGGGAIVLVPEIALTPQTINRFASRFGDVIAVLHSQLGAGERHDEFSRIRSGAARVAIGPRSALFAPVKNLRLIVVDEEHEPSYKQDEAPRYNARDVAVVRGAIEHCAVLLGSATPSLESWRNAQTGKYDIATLSHRAVSESSLPRTLVVDMRAEIARSEGKLPIFSQTLVEEIRRRLDAGEQTMLLLNRRGWAPTVSCPKCGHSETCTECAIGMTYHRDDDVLRCHVCGAHRPAPKCCPECGNPDYRYSGAGTQRVEEAAKAIFPRAKIARMDLDVTSRRRSHEEILSDFRVGAIDILVGTQMIAKGLDFPNVTLAGILNADSGLNIPDFRAGERTFQLIAQMAGRTGRGLRPGVVIVQTLEPDHRAVVCAKTEDYRSFAEQEMKEREELLYPPFSHLARVLFRGRSQGETEAYSARFAQAVGENSGYLMGDPGPAPLEKANGAWRFQLTLRGASPRLIADRLRAALAAHPPGERISVSFDMDAMGAT